jgi:predicted metal-dependent hydrolase
LDVTIRQSKRAKRPRITVSRAGVVEVVIPQGFDSKQVPALVQAHQAWIKRTQAHVCQIRQSLCPDSIGNLLPQTIALRACHETWAVTYEAKSGPQVTLTCQDHQLQLEGPVASIAPCQQVLRQWLRRQAKHHLPAWLAQASQTHGLAYNRVTIRTQKTRWGSCSDKKSINLNDKLLFLPQELVQYVLEHRYSSHLP